MGRDTPVSARQSSTVVTSIRNCAAWLALSTALLVLTAWSGAALMSRAYVPARPVHGGMVVCSY